MALVARGVDSGTGINVLADSGATGDMQVVKLGIATLGSQALIPADVTNGMLVQVSNASLPSAISSVVPGTGAANLGKAEDAPASSGDVGVFALAVRRDVPTSSAAAGDYHELQVDALGRLWVSGTYAEDAVSASGDYGKFVLVIRRDTAVADGAAGDYVGLHVDALGKLRITGTYPEDSAAADGQEILAVAAVRRDTQAVGSGTDGDYSSLNVDAFGRLRVSDRNEVSVAATTALATNLVVKASAGKLLGFYGYTTVTQFIQLHNTASLPADTAVPVGVFPITANTPFSLWLEHPQPCSTGITLCNSTTGPTKTIGAANTWITALYE